MLSVHLLYLKSPVRVVGMSSGHLEVAGRVCHSLLLLANGEAGFFEYQCCSEPHVKSPKISSGAPSTRWPFLPS